MTPFHEQILLWLVDHRGLQQEIAPLSEALLIKQLADLSAALTSGSEDDVLEEKLTNLFSSLITPVLPELETAERLIVVADGSLAAIPFGGLWDRSSGEFLGSKFSIARALTCSGLVRRLESTDIGAPRPAASILAVGNPLMPESLSQLPAAEVEARELASRSPESTLLVGRLATVSNFKRELVGADHVHIATHTSIDETISPFPSLVFSPDMNTDFLLSPQMIRNLELPIEPSIFLSACSAASLAEREDQSLEGLVSAFLSSGASFVIAPLWSIDDRLALDFARDFYSAGCPQAEAWSCLSWARYKDPSTSRTLEALAIARNTYQTFISD